MDIMCKRDNTQIRSPYRKGHNREKCQNMKYGKKKHSTGRRTVQNFKIQKGQCAEKNIIGTICRK